MSRMGMSPTSSDALEAKFLPDMEDAKPEEGAAVDLIGDGQHKIYMHRGQLEVYNFGSRHTKLRCARGWGKTSYLGFYNLKCVLGLRRQIGLFLGASAKQLMCRTMPNMLKVFNLLGFSEGVYYFRGQAPAKLRWETPLAKPRVWENVIHFQNGACIMGASLAVKGSCNGINAAWLSGDETKYMKWSQVKEEAFPTLRGDFMPPSAHKVEIKRWGYGTDPKTNPYYCSSCFCSDAGLTQAQTEWERDGEENQTEDINIQLTDLLAKLKYLEKHNPRMAVELAQNEAFLKKLHLLRSQSDSYWSFSSLDNVSLLGIDWVRTMKRSLPSLMYEIQILGRKKGLAKDGFYCNFSELNTYTSSEITDVAYDKYSTKVKYKALDSTNWYQNVETETLDYDQLQHDGETCELDLDLQYDEPLRIGVDCNSQLNVMVVGQTRMYQGKPSVMVMKEFFVMAPVRLLGLVKMFAVYYRPFLRRGCKEVIFYVSSSIKQGGATAYAVENSEDSRFDKVIERELSQYGFCVTIGEFVSWRHERKYQYLNDCLASIESPSIYICREAERCQYLLTAIENAGVTPGGSFKKDKSREKLKASDEESVGGDPRTRTDVTDAFDDLIIGIKECAENRRRIGGGLKGRFSNLAGIPR